MKKNETVEFIGAPNAVGERFGSVLAPYIRNRVEQYCGSDQALGDVSEKVEALQALLSAEAPHWIEEYRAVAEAARVGFDQILALNCAAPLTNQPSCTSALAVGNRTKRGWPLLVKVRDERPQHQAMGYRRTADFNGMLFSTDPCNLGVGQGVNEHGLAVANNSGGLVPDSPEPLGFNDCHVTRLLLERARTTTEALAVFQELQANHRIGLVDGVRGMIFLVADSRGHGLAIEASRDRLEYSHIQDDVAVWSNHWLLPGSKRFSLSADPDHPLVKSSIVRYEQGKTLLADKKNVALADLEAFAKDEANAPFSICNGSDTFPWRTVSAFIYELDPQLERPVRVAPGLPTRTGFKSVPVWRDETPLDYLFDWTG